MGLFKNFPYTNFHELNLDWFYSKWHDLFDKGSAAITGAEDAAKDAITAANGATVAAGNAATAAGNAANAATSANSAATAATSAAARAESAALANYAAASINLLDNSLLTWFDVIDRGSRKPSAINVSKTYTAPSWLCDRWSVAYSEDNPEGGACNLRFSSSGVQAVGQPCWICQHLPISILPDNTYSLSIYIDADYTHPAYITVGNSAEWNDLFNHGHVDNADYVWIQVPTDHWISAVALRPGGSISLPYVQKNKADDIAACALYLQTISSAQPARECKASSSGKYLMYLPEMRFTPSKPSTLGTLYIASTSSLTTLQTDAYTFEVKDGPYVEITPTTGAPTAYSVVTIWPSMPANFVADSAASNG